MSSVRTASSGVLAAKTVQSANGRPTSSALGKQEAAAPSSRSNSRSNSIASENDENVPRTTKPAMSSTVTSGASATAAASGTSMGTTSHVIYRGAQLWKLHFTKAAAPEPRMFRVFRAAELPDGCVGVGMSAGEGEGEADGVPLDAATAVATASGELFLGYKPQKAGLFGMGKGDKWRVLPLSRASWIRCGTGSSSSSSSGSGGEDASAVIRRARAGGIRLPPPNQCFSVMVECRSLDVVCSSAEQCAEWVSALADAVMAAKAWHSAATHRHSSSSSGSSSGSNAEEEEEESKVAESKEEAEPVPAPTRRAAAAAAAATTSAPAATVAAAAAAVGAWDELDRQGYFQQALFDAIRRKNYDDALLCFEDGCDPELVDVRTGDNALLCAARVGAPDIVRLCLERSVPFMPHGNAEQNALSVAVCAGALGCVREVVAAASNTAGLLPYVLALMDSAGNTPLHMAAERGYAQITDFLLQHSTAELSVRNGAARTPLHAAAAGAARYEQEGGAATTASSAVPSGLRTPSRKAGLPPATPKSAARKAKERQAEVDAGLVDEPDFTATVQALMEYGSDSVLDWGEESGASALHLAASGGAVGTVRVLLETLANPAIRNSVTGLQPADVAAAAGHTAVVDLLQEYTSGGAGNKVEYTVMQPALPGTAAAATAAASVPAWQQEAGSEVTYVQSNAVADPYSAWTYGDAATATGTAGGYDYSGYTDGYNGGYNGGYTEEETQAYYQQYYYQQQQEQQQQQQEEQPVQGMYVHPWAQYWDEGASCPYYCNTDSGESSWELPQPVIDYLVAWGIDPVGYYEGRYYGDFSAAFAAAYAANTAAEGAADAPATAATAVAPAAADTTAAVTATATASAGFSTPAKSSSNSAAAASVKSPGPVPATADVMRSPAKGVKPGAKPSGPAPALSPAPKPLISAPAAAAAAEAAATLPPATPSSKAARVAHSAISGAGAVKVSATPGKLLATPSRTSAAAAAAATAATVRPPVLPTPASVPVAAPAPAPAAAPAAAAAPAPAPASSSSSTTTNVLADERVVKFVRMLRMGVPMPSTLHKMRMEGIPELTIEAVEAAVARHVAAGGSVATLGLDATATAAATAAAPTTTTAPAAPSTPVSKDAGAGGAKSASDVQREALAAVTAAADKFDKYVKMKKLGVPLGAIKGKMAQDGLGAEDQKLFLSAFATQSALESMGLASPAAKASGGTGGSGKEEAGDAATAAPTVGAGAGIKPPAVPEPPANRRTIAPTLKLHWDPLRLDAERYKKSLWGRLQEQQQQQQAAGKATGGSTTTSSNGAMVALEDSDVAILTSLFAAKAAPAATAGVSGSAAAAAPKAAGKASDAAADAPPAPDTTSSASKTTLLDFKRANNLNISLAQFRKYASHTAIFTAVYRLDAAILPRETLDKLLCCMPTAEELTLMKSYKGAVGDLMECDKFFLAVAKVPRLPAKVSAFAALQAFPPTAADIKARCAGLIAASRCVMDSERLQAVLAAVLSIGNVLNAGNSALEAAAISLDSLLKLSITKGVDKKTTLMDALVMLVSRKQAISVDQSAANDLMAWTDDLAGMAGAGKTELGDLKADAAKLKSALLAAGREAEAEARDIEKETAPPPAPPAMPPPTNALSAGAAVAAAAAATAAAASAAVAAPAVPVAGDSRSAMLAEMMRKRAGGPAAPPAPGSVPSAAAPAAPLVATLRPGAGLAKPAPAPASSNPCAMEDRRHFTSTLRSFVAGASSELSAVEAAVAEAEATAAELAAYFGEEPKTTPPSKVFCVLRDFATAFQTSMAAAKKRKAAEARAAAAAAAK